MSKIQLIRPLLGQSRASIHAYAKKNSIPWREDRSNASDDYQRNVVRNRILPLLKEHFGDAISANLASSASVLQGYWDHTLKPELDKRVQACCPGQFQVSIECLANQEDVWKVRVALEILYSWMPGHKVSRLMAHSLLDLLNAQVGRKLMLPTGTVWRERSKLVFMPFEGQSLSQDEIVIEDIEKENSIVFVGGKLDISMHVEIPETLTQSDPCIILVDKDSLTLPLRLRAWKAGDRILPFGMAGHKKISDLLTDAKIPSRQRASTYVLEANGEVIWVLGVRMSDSIRVTGETKSVLTIQYYPAG